MTAEQIIRQFTEGMLQTSFLEYIAVFFGIGSVWYSKKEDILVYPVGLVSTIIYVYLSIEGHLLGEASVNVFYSVMSVYGWVLWTRKDGLLHPLLKITYSSRRDWIFQLSFFAVMYGIIFISLTILKKYFAPGAIPWADALASATAYTGMWLMAKKKVESWHWWIATNTASIPLYFVKGYVFTSVFYFILLLMAFWGLVAWRKKLVIR
ncbi:MAG: nicotinamide riboside transporter PnuC [Chitinophagaceae bacterium]